MDKKFLNSFAPDCSIHKHLCKINFIMKSQGSFVFHGINLIFVTQMK